MADTSSSKKPPVVPPVSVVPPVPWQPTAFSGAMPVGRPQGVVSAQFQSRPRAMAPTVLANLGPVGTVAPPQMTNQPKLLLPRRYPLAPPHAGDFRRGGPDAMPGAGIGAPPFPVPGYDGYRRWVPDEDVARRAESSDVDAHRPSMALRAPSMGIDGDVGAGDPPLPAAPSWHGLGRTPRASRSASVATLPGTEGEVAPPAFLAALPPAPPAIRPPTGPWDGGVQAVVPPPILGVDSATSVEAPPEGHLEPTLDGPQPIEGNAPMRPVQEGLEAFKAAMRAMNPAVEARPPKPVMPGTPPGGGGGRGPGLAGAQAAEEGYQASRAVLALAEANVQEAEEYLAFTGGTDKAALANLEQRRLDLKSAYASHDQALESSGASRQAGGSDLDKRLAEEADRQAVRNNRENERERKKLETRPNHLEWSVGSGAMSRSRDVRAGADAAIGRAGQLRGKADPGAVKDVRALGKKAKELAKAAKKAGKRAKDAAKYGTKKEAADAALEAKGEAEYAEIALNATLEALKEAEGTAGQGTEPSKVLLDPGTGGGQPPGSKAVPHLHECSEDPNVVCQGWVTMTCPTGQKMACHFETPAEEEERRKKEDGSKGKGRGGPQRPGDGISSLRGDASAVVPHDSGVNGIEAGLTGEREDSSDKEGEAEREHDLEGRPIEKVPAEDLRYFSSGALAVRLDDGRWVLLPPGVVHELFDVDEEGFVTIEVDRFTNAVAAAAQVNILERHGLDGYNGDFEDFVEDFRDEYESERDSLLQQFTISEADLEFSVPLSEALKATGKGVKELWEVSRVIPALDLLHDAVDVADAIARGEFTEAGTTTIFAAVPFSSKLAKKALKALKGEEIILNVGKKVDEVPTGALRKDLKRGAEAGVELPEGRSRLTSTIEAHHPLAQDFRERLAKLGIMADRYGAWATSKSHRLLHATRKYNKRFEELLERVKNYPRAKAAREIARFVKREASEVGLTIYVLIGKK